MNLKYRDDIRITDQLNDMLRIIHQLSPMKLNCNCNFSQVLLWLASNFFGREKVCWHSKAEEKKDLLLLFVVKGDK